MIMYFQEVYTQFLANFPGWLHPFISLALAALLVYSIFQVIKQNFVYLILLVILLPASIPFLRNLFDTVMAIVKYLFGQA
jgi:hypothetical protein